VSGLRPAIGAAADGAIGALALGGAGGAAVGGGLHRHADGASHRARCARPHAMRGARRSLGRVSALLAALAFVLAVTWLGGIVWFARSLPLSVADMTTKTDAIVVLTGGSQRVTRGL